MDSDYSDDSTILTENHMSASDTEELESEDISDVDFEQNKWAYLPSIPLQMIYSFVPRKDQTNMSIVCRTWLAEFEAPCNWKTLRFVFPERQCQYEELPVVKFAKRFGHLVKHVEIDCRHKKAAQVFDCTDLEQFVDAIVEKSNLKSVSIRHLGIIMNKLNVSYRQRVVDCIKRIFQSQNRITSVEIRSCGFRSIEAASIFYKLLYQSQSPVNVLKTRNMLCKRKDDFEIHRTTEDRIRLFRWFTKILDQVEEWHVDYGEFLESVMVAYHQLTPEQRVEVMLKPRGNMKRMIVRCEAWALGGVNGISQDAWKSLQKFAPDLKVDFNIGPSVDLHQSMKLLLARHMPLRYLELRTVPRQFKLGSLTTDEIFDYLYTTSLNSSLESFKLVWGNCPSTTLTKEIDEFVRRSPELRSVEVDVQYLLPNLEDLLQSWSQNRPKSIQMLAVKIRKASEANLDVTKTMLQNSPLDFTWNNTIK